MPSRALARDQYLPTEKVIVGVDGSRSRSGGAVRHIVGIFEGGDPRSFGIDHVHFWGHEALVEAAPVRPWLTSHLVRATSGSIFRQMLWQRFSLPAEARRLGVQVMFNTDAGSVCPFQPCVTLSQDMLSFEPGEILRYPWPGRARARLTLLRFLQILRLKQSVVAIFLSGHAQRVIGQLAPTRQSVIIPHGVDEEFLSNTNTTSFAKPSNRVRCLYVSNAAPYKHQWNVVEAVARLRKDFGFDVGLRLVGGGSGPALNRLDATIARHDPERRFVEKREFVGRNEILDELLHADVFVFASSCENLPITLLEAMASGLPIACSNRGPMPEVLKDAGVYFDPEDPETIAAAIRLLIEDLPLRRSLAARARDYARNFTWSRCAESTWSVLASIGEAKTS
jgi:glycosyltransferase involved in cell wall biosynthesis